MLHLLFKHSRLIFFWGVVFAILALAVSLLFPRYYSAESQVLIISRGSGGVDPYTQAKAAEQIGGNLAQVMQTTDFYSKVMESQTVTFDRARWTGLDERTRRKDWVRDVRAEEVYGTGLLKITVYSRTKEDVAAFSQAITDTIASRGWEYVGGDVTIKTVNTPLVSRLPGRPNFIINTILGFVLGGVFSGWWVMRYKRGVFGRL